jgi:hypothetical protein
VPRAITDERIEAPAAAQSPAGDAARAVIALDSMLGSEIRKSRPCVVNSPPELLGVVPAKTLAQTLATRREVFAQ